MVTGPMPVPGPASPRWANVASCRRRRLTAFGPLRPQKDGASIPSSHRRWITKESESQHREPAHPAVALRDLRPRRRLALVGRVPSEPAAALRVQRTRRKTCAPPSLLRNVLLGGHLAGKPELHATGARACPRSGPPSSRSSWRGSMPLSRGGAPHYHPLASSLHQDEVMPPTTPPSTDNRDHRH